MKCGKENNFVKKCPLTSTSTKVSLLGEEDELSAFHVFKVSANQSSDSSFVTNIIDTGASCSVLPIQIYKKATGNFDLKHVTPAKYFTLSYDGGIIPVLGTVA